MAVWVVLDQLSKHWAVNHLRNGRVKHVVWTLDFTLSYNSGMAFGRARGFGPVVGIVALVVVVGLLLSLSSLLITLSNLLLLLPCQHLHRSSSSTALLLSHHLQQ